MRLILASGSPRRKQLMKKIAENFDVVPSDCQEVCSATAPVEVASSLACLKATNVLRKTEGGCVVVGCDTVVDVDGVVLGKPADEAQAADMLRLLSDRTHCVHTGVCIASDRGVSVFSETSRVTFRKLTEGEIAQYVQSGAPMDKAGAYGIQETDFACDVQGSYDNVVGFPTERVAEELKKFFY